MLINNSRLRVNLAMLKLAARTLGDIKDDVVFLGGCTTALFITDLGAPDVRPTLDVDCIVNLVSLGDYYRLEERLVKQGLKKSINDDVICRWHYGDLVLDIMPTNEKILGFGNSWYKDAIKHSVIHHLNEDLSIKVVSAPYFLATKFEAFRARGKNDYLSSHDFEDIMMVIDGRAELFDEINNADYELQQYLTKIFIKMLDSQQFHLAIPGHFNYGALTDDRIQIVLDRIEKIAALV